MKKMKIKKIIKTENKIKYIQKNKKTVITIKFTSTQEILENEQLKK